MAIIENENGRSNVKETLREQVKDDRIEQEAQEQPKKESRPPIRYTSLAQIGRLNPTPLAMSDTAEALEQFRKDFVEAMPSKDDINLIKAQVFPIDASAAGLPFSLLVVAGQKQGKEKLGIAYHTFILASSADELIPREESIRGRRVKIVQVPGDAFDDKCRAVVKDVLKNHYKTENLFSADGEIIHRHFPNAKENPDAIINCVKNSYTAIKLALDRLDVDVPVLCLADSQGSRNSIHVQHRQNHIFDRAHQPIRADLVIDFITREQNDRRARDTLDQLVTGQRISRVGGYYDLIYSPAEGAILHNDLYGRSNSRLTGDEHQFYVLRFINTFVDTIDFSPNSFLLAVATVNAAGEEREIMRAFEPNLSLGENDSRNIGALSIETNLNNDDRGFSDRIETKLATFNFARRRALLRATIQPGIVYSFDVPECGASSWQWVDWMAAADGSKRAMDRIYDAACRLTDGEFEEFYRREDPIVDSNVERIHGGYYTGGDGSSILDLRDFDYLSLLNAINPERIEDLDDIKKWSYSSSLNEDSIFTQSERYEILKTYLPSAVITGMYQRYNLNRDFNRALVDAILACKLSLSPASSTSDGGERYRTTYGNIDQVLNRPGAVGLYRNRRSYRDDERDRYFDRFDDRTEGRGGVMSRGRW